MENITLEEMTEEIINGNTKFYDKRLVGKTDWNQIPRFHDLAKYLNKGYDSHTNPICIENSDFTGLMIDGAKLRRGYFNLGEIKLFGTILNGSYFRKVNLAGAKLENAYFHGAELEDGYFNGAKLKNVDFDGAKLKDSSFKWAELENVSLFEAELRNIDLGG